MGHSPLNATWYDDGHRALAMQRSASASSKATSRNLSDW
jgi:hypothetical protein